MPHRVLVGDSRATLKTLPDRSVHCVITSPPYWGLRSYLKEGDPLKVFELGCEFTPDEYVQNLVTVFREVHRVLRDDGTLWLNLGDSYAAQRSGWSPEPQKGAVPESARGDEAYGKFNKKSGRRNAPKIGLKNKDLVGIPWMVAFALRSDGWYLRQDVIWCLSGGAWVYARTQKGEMPVMIKDLVRLNPSTVELWNGARWTRVLGWHQSAVTKEKFELVLRSGERIGCTGGHLWPTQRGNVATRDLHVGDVLATCQIPEPDGALPPGYMTLDLAWLTGIYLAEGSRSDDMAQLSFHADEAKWLPRIKSVAHHLGGSMTYTILGNQLSVRLYGRVLMAHFENYIGGHTAHDKHLTNACWRLPNEYLKELTCGYLDGDGHYDPKNPRICLNFTRNYALERDLRILASRLGANLSLRTSTAICQTGRFPSFSGDWKWVRSGHGNELIMGEVKEIRASRARHFWDIEVEDDPHLFALASGVLTHNSKPNPMPESVTDRCTRSHEYLFMLTKRDRYYYDQTAIREEPSPSVIRRAPYKVGGSKLDLTRNDLDKGTRSSFSDYLEGRNKRSVWNISPKPFSGAHFATFPPDLVEPCLLAGTSEVGCCSKMVKKLRLRDNLSPTDHARAMAFLASRSLTP